LLQRARTSLAQHRNAHEAPPVPGSAQERHLVRRFAEAFTADDINTLVGLLTDDAWLAMPPAPHEYTVSRRSPSFLHASATWRAGRRLRLRPTRANGQPAFSCHLVDTVEQPAGLIVLTLTADHLHGITRFLDNQLQEHFEE
jgi:RNA polymerase sigma-70 factor (ECF subfamily)